MFALPNTTAHSLLHRADRTSGVNARQPCGLRGTHGCPQLRPRGSPCTTTPVAAAHQHNGTTHAPTSDAPTITNGDSLSSATGAANSGALPRAEFPKFVQFFRQASPYIAGHRGKTFVIIVPGNVTSNRALLQSIMSDIAMLHGLGVRLVVVVGAQNQIDTMLQERGMVPAYMGGYRITDTNALKIAVEAAGQVRTACEQILSKGPAIPMIRRHTKGEGEIHFEPALRVISGNFVTAKRRGVVDGVDFGFTGEVRFVLKDAISNQLDGGNVVLLSNLGFTAGGEVLNCNTADVGLHAAVELGADKMFFLHLDEVSNMHLPEWLPLSDAQDMLVKKLEDSLTGEQMAVLKESIQQEVTTAQQWNPYPSSPRNMPQQAANLQASRVASRLATSKREEVLVDLDVWSASGLPTAVSTCVVACCKGERGRESLAGALRTARRKRQERTATAVAHGSAPSLGNSIGNDDIHSFASAASRISANGSAQTLSYVTSNGVAEALSFSGASFGFRNGYSSSGGSGAHSIHGYASQSSSYSPGQTLIHEHGLSSELSYLLGNRLGSGSNYSPIDSNGNGQAHTHDIWNRYCHANSNGNGSGYSHANNGNGNGITHANSFSHRQALYVDDNGDGNSYWHASSNSNGDAHASGYCHANCNGHANGQSSACSCGHGTSIHSACGCGVCDHDIDLQAARLSRFTTRELPHKGNGHGAGNHEDHAPLYKGIKRAHLLDARLDGGLLLELYSRDGVGTMISADFYEGIRRAGPADLDAIRALLRPLEEAGTLAPRSKEDIANMLQDFTVVERENKVLGCALLVPLGLDDSGISVAEVGAFCIDPAFRGSGRGDSLLDYMEQEARRRGVQRLVLLTTRTADWFEQRDFKFVGPAFSNPDLPEGRRQKVNPARNSQLYAKQMAAADGSEPGKRIGF